MIINAQNTQSESNILTGMNIVHESKDKKFIIDALVYTVCDGVFLNIC